MNENLNKKKSDYLLELALEEWLEQDPDMVKYKDAETTQCHEFSEEHKKHMKKIFRMADKVEEKAKRKYRTVQIAASIAFFLCFSTITVTQVEAFRLPIVRFFMEIKEKSALIGSYAENRLQLSIEYEQYVPTYVPDNYVVVDVKEFDSGFYIKYESEKDYTWYRYCYWNQKENLDCDVENGTISEMEINGYPAVVIKKQDEIRIIVNSEMQRFYINGHISYEDAVKILSSINF